MRCKHTHKNIWQRKWLICPKLLLIGAAFCFSYRRANSKCVRLLINRTKVGSNFGGISSWFMSGPVLMFDSPKNNRDITYIGDCDDACLALAEALGWKDELQDLIKTEHDRLNKENQNHKKDFQSKDGEKDDEKLEKQARKADL